MLAVPTSEIPLVRVENLGKCYHVYENPAKRLADVMLGRIGRSARERWVLRNVSLSIGRGETVGVIGLNGSGKSTLLQLLCGTIVPTEGEVSTSGRMAALLELGSGFNPDFSGRENIFINGALHGMSREEVANRMPAIVEFADLGDYIEQPVRTYSSGMYVRLAFAVLAHVGADTLVIDEALAVGDALFVQKCMRFLRGFQDSGAILLVSHDLGAIQSFCSRVIWLDHGRVVLSGDTREVCEAYLSFLIEAQQGARVPVAVKTRTTSPQAPRRIRDPRWQGAAEASDSRKIAVDPFDPNAACLGAGGALIEAVELLSEQGTPTRQVVGGELVTLVIRARALRSLRSAIVGFIVKDRLGQGLFSDNTFLSNKAHPPAYEPGEQFAAKFTFQMPILPRGDYSVVASIAEGTQNDHVQQHWIHDALILHSHSSSVCTGLVGIPMLDVSLERIAR